MAAADSATYPPTRVVSVSRQARAELSSLRAPFKHLVSAEGAYRLGLVACCLYAACYCLQTLVTQLECDANTPTVRFDASRDRFVDIAGTWFGLNVSVALLLATCDVGLVGVDKCHRRFREYPLFAWLYSCLFQGLFFTPASVVIALTGLGLTNDTSWACALAAQAAPGIAGMQLRELLLFRSDWMMTAHHNLTMLLAATIWGGCRAHPTDLVRCLTAVGAAAAMEGGSVGCVLWTVSGGGFVASVLYALLMTGCHLLILPLYVTYVRLYVAASFDGGPALFFLVTLVTVGTIPLMWTRTTFMLGELGRGVASGVFVEEASGAVVSNTSSAAERLAARLKQQAAQAAKKTR